MPTTRDIRIAKWILILLFLCLAAEVLLNWLEEPVISVDYVYELNRLRQSEGHQDGNDGSIAFLKACKVMEDQRYGGYEHLVFNNQNGERQFVLTKSAWPSDMNNTERSNVRAWLADNDQAFRMAEYAVGKENCRLHLYARDGDLNWVMIHRDLLGVRELCDAFFWRAKMKAFDGDVTGSMHDVLLVSKMSRHFVRYPCVPEWWLGVGMVNDSCWAGLEIAARTNFASDQLAGLAAGLESNGKAYYSLGTALEYERFLIHDMVQRYFSDDGHGNGRLLAGHAYREDTGSERSYHSPMDKVELFTECLGYAYTTENRKITLAHCDRDIAESIRLSELPLWELQGRYAADVRSVGTGMEDNIMIGMSNRVLTRYIYAPQETRNMVEGTLTTLAILRYKADKNALPEGLDDLVKAGYLKEVLLDRYSGRPFVYEKTIDTFKLYSVGDQTKDDGRHRTGPINFWPPQRYKSRPDRLIDPNLAETTPPIDPNE